MTPSIKSANSVVEIVRNQQPISDSETESDDDNDDIFSSTKESSVGTSVRVEDVVLEMQSKVEVPETPIVASAASVATNSDKAAGEADTGKTALTKSRIFGKVCSLLKSKQ